MTTHICTNEVVRVTWADDIATITLDGQNEVNAINLAMAEDFNEAVSRVEESSARVGVVRGNGRVYCAGGDLSQDPEEFVQSIDETLDAVVSIFESSRPYVAAIHGAAIGGGLEIALACDLRVAEADARLQLPEASLGIIPAAGAIRLLAQIVGIGRARDILLTGRELTGETAAMWGLVSRTTNDDLGTTTQSLAQDIARQSPDAVAAILQSLNEAHPRPVTLAKLDLELARPLAASEEFRRAKESFVHGDDPEGRGE